ncbi:MAG: hypothetical protein JO053_08620 [Acidobacteria bacterium]|nr:hypothetical protein [Acidobacteriota bacterium]
MQEVIPGDYLIFQLEAGYALLRLIGTDETEGEGVWHVAAFNELFLDVDSAERSVAENKLSLSLPHAALTTRAFESTQTARIANAPVTEGEAARVADWRTNSGEISDKSIRLLLGWR